MKLTRLVLLCVAGAAIMTILPARIRVFGYTKSQAIDVVSTAQAKTILCYETAAEADRVGANTSLLLENLTAVADLLFRADLALEADEFNASVSFASRANEKLEGLITEATALREVAQQRQYLDSFGTGLGSTIGAMIVIFGSFLVWRILQARSSHRNGASLGEHRSLFTGAVGLLLFLAISPMLGRFLSLPRTELFTEFWILGPNQRAQSYPFNITLRRQYRLFLGIRNRLGSTSYYKVAVKLSNHTSSRLDSDSSSEFPANFNKTFFVADEDAVEHLITFSFDYELNQPQFQIDIKTFTLNEVVIDMSGQNLSWDSEMRGFMGCLRFELWIYNQTSRAFEYHNRFLSLTLNFTAAGLLSSGL